MFRKKQNRRRYGKAFVALALVLSVVLSAAVFSWLTEPAIALDGEEESVQPTVLENDQPQEAAQPEVSAPVSEDAEPLDSEPASGEKAPLPAEELPEEALPAAADLPAEAEDTAQLTAPDTRAVAAGSGTVPLDGDYAYVEKFEIVDIADGTAPFDTSDDPSSLDYKNRPGNDESAHNGRVRTFDKVTYTLGYTTKLHTEYEQNQISGGYLLYQFDVKITDDNQCDFDIEDMSWMGTRVNSMDALNKLADAQNGYIYGDVTNSSGVRYLRIYGKKWLVKQEENPSVIPGEGRLNVILNVYNMKSGDRLNVRFYAWLDHNSIPGECEDHGITEWKVLEDQSVEVTAELRMNVELNKFVYSYCSGAGIFDFSTGNDKALNKDKGEVYGRILGCGITLQLQNDRKDRGLKGCEIPQGKIQLQLDLSTYFCYGKNYSQSVSLTGGNRALVWRYGPNMPPEPNKPPYDNRNVSEYSHEYCTEVPWNTAGNAELNLYNRYNKTTPKNDTEHRHQLLL